MCAWEAAGTLELFLSTKKSPCSLDINLRVDACGYRRPLYPEARRGWGGSNSAERGKIHKRQLDKMMINCQGSKTQAKDKSEFSVRLSQPPRVAD